MLLTRVLKFPVLPLFFLAHFTHHFATGAIVPLLPWLRDDLSLDYFQAGLLVSSLHVIAGFAQLAAAGIADRWGRARLIGLGLLGAALTAIGIGLSPNFYVLFAFLFLMGLAASTYHAPASSLITQYFPQQMRGRTLGVHSVGGSSSLFATPAAAVLIAGVTGNWRYSFLGLAIPAIFVGFLFLTAGRNYEKITMAAVASTPRERVSLLEVARLIGVLVAIAMVSTLLMSTVSSFLPLYLVDKHGVPKELAGLIPSLIFGAGMLGAPFGGALSDRIGRKPVIMLSVFFAGPLLLAMTFIPTGSVTVSVVAAAIILGIYGLANSARMPTTEGLIADSVPWHRRASVVAIYFLLAQETGAITTPFVGLLANSYGLDFAFTTLAMIGIASSILVLLIRKRV